MSPSRCSRLFLAVLIAGMLLAAWAPAARAQEPTPVNSGNGVISDDQVNAIAKQMFCPVCENVPLDVCPTQACHQWRETIRTMLAEGKSEQEIKDHFVQQYGDRVLAEPPRRGFNWLVYVVPPLFLLLGIFLLVSLLRSWKRPAPEQSSPPTISEDEYVSRLEEELKRRG